MRQRAQNSTTYPLQFLLVLSIDHITAATGKTPTVTLSKNGAAFGAAAGAVTEIANGVYSLAGNATDRNTLGELWATITATGCDPVTLLLCDIVTVDVFAAQGGLVAPDNATIATRASQASVDILAGYVDTEVAAIKAKTDNLPAAPAAVSDIPTVAAIVAGQYAQPIEGTITMLQKQRLDLAANGGKTNGGGTGTFKIRNPSDTKDRVTASVDANGNRSIVTLDLT